MPQFKTLALAMAVSAVMALPASAAMTDGTYTGVGQGKNGEVTVELQVASGKLAQVRVVKHVETPGISDAALTNFPQSIVDAQSLNVDVVSGATLTSEGIRLAVADAIRKAGGDPDAFAAVPVQKKVATKLIKDHADIIVVGAGGSGMSAAVRAESLGANVILIEQISRAFPINVEHMGGVKRDRPS